VKDLGPLANEVSPFLSPIQSSSNGIPNLEGQLNAKSSAPEWRAHGEEVHRKYPPLVATDVEKAFLDNKQVAGFDVSSPEAFKEIRTTAAASREHALASQNAAFSTANRAYYSYMNARNQRRAVQASIFGRELTDIQDEMLNLIFQMEKLAQTAVEKEFAAKRLIELENGLANRPLTPQQRAILRNAIEFELLHHSLLNNMM
jgi:hypothetical protein